ncbi:uncharacterized protein LOC129762697 isoform X3 [Toxorhynchites rutilus septentrionalis]|uniref:uncharacterized protein LOC129762697 isoform X3 n=1 Tax=Toxorhynchites rutilus septentrionalis TaxID=329112 RepID=UPI002479DD73|nr:uncharacterized protein LOC129762697 isoform X3 [Toxorhynchites rutilus septentrionalis]
MKMHQNRCFDLPAVQPSTPTMSSSPSHDGTPGSSSSTRDGNNNLLNGDSLLKLALKKPKSWRWELTTSSSSPNVCFPRIQLFDSRTGALMIEVDKPDCVVRSEEVLNGSGSSGRSRSSQERRNRDDPKYRRSRSSCVREKVTTTGEFLTDVYEQLQGRGMGYKMPTSISQYREPKQDDDNNGSFCLQKSQSASEVRTGLKKKVRKTYSSRSSSILGRINELHRSSSEEELSRPTPHRSNIPEICVIDEPKPKDKPKIYKLVRSNAGTLMVREESFHTKNSLRRRQQLEEAGLANPEDELHVEKRIFFSDIPGSQYHDTDDLISTIMLSHTLQDVQDDSIGSMQSMQRSRRSASVGSNSRGHNGHRRSRESPLVTHPRGSSSSNEDLSSLAESRFGSIKRRGRVKYSRNKTASASIGGSASSRRTGEQPDENGQVNGDQTGGNRNCQRSSLAAVTNCSPDSAIDTTSAVIYGDDDDNDDNNSNDTERNKSDSGGKRNPTTCGYDDKSSAKAKTRRGGTTTRSSSSSSFLAGTVAATDQVLLKLVQRIALLRSSSSRSGSNTNGDPPSKKSKKSSNNSSKNKKNKSQKKPSKRDIESGSSSAAAASGEDKSDTHGPEGRLTPPPSPRAVVEVLNTTAVGPVEGQSPPLSVRKLLPPVEAASVPNNSGNYHAQIAPLFVDSDESGDSSSANSRTSSDRTEIGHLVEPRQQRPVPDSSNAIECTSFSELILDRQQQPRSSPSTPTSSFAFGGSDCNLEFCELEQSCDEILLLEEQIFECCERDAGDDDDDDDGSDVVSLIKPAEEQQETINSRLNNMGANVSRHHEKGLTGRRAQSTDNLKSDQTQPYQYHYIGNNNNNNNSKCVPPDLAPGCDFIGGDGETGQDRCEESHHPHEQLNSTTNTTTTAAGSNGINPQDRNKFCGSLPNHLDADVACEAIFKQNEFLQTHLKNVLATHQQQQPEYVTVSGGAAGAIGGGTSGSTNMTSCQGQQRQHPPTYRQSSSPFYSSSSGKGSTVSSTALGSSTFQSGTGPGTGGGGGDRSAMKLPLHRSTVDTGYDQGYGSERSPEDELPPPLLLMHEAQYNEILASSQLNQQPPISVIEPNDLQRFWNYEKAAASLMASGEYSFITKDTVFLVQVPKGTRGLGLSVSGGSDSSAPFPGLIRIKRLFPHQAAWATGMLQPGDILLEANGIPLTGLTNYEALEVLRTAPNYVTLTVCRPQDEQYRKLSPPSEPPQPPTRNALPSEPKSQLQMQFSQQQQPHMMPYFYQQQQHQQQQQFIFPPQTLAFTPLDSIHTSFNGEFEIVLTKQQGSLGFTLRKEDESVLGHYVRALVRDPALNDGRIKPGDKIVAVNDVPISQMTHEEAVIFLRQAADVVKLRLYRDQAQTPLSAQSPTGADGDERGICSSASTSTVGHGGGGSKPKPHLRPEALNLLTDIAYRKQTAACSSASGGGGSDSTSSSVKSSNASPRRLRRGLQNQSKKSYDNHGYQHSGGETSNNSDSETSTIVSQAGSYHPRQHHHQVVPGAGVYHSVSCRSCGGNMVPPVVHENLDESYYCDDEIDAESLYEEDGGEHQKRPNYLNLAGESGSTPMSSRKPRFQFSVATTNAYELNNLDNDALDAPTRYALNGEPMAIPGGDGAGGVGGAPAGSDQFISLPCETFLVACKTENDLNADSTDAIYVKHFAHKSPLYSSVNVPLKDTGNNVSEVVDAVEKGGKKSLMKWKGATLASDEEDTPSHGASNNGTPLSGMASSSDGTHTRNTPDADSSLAATIGTSTTTPTTERELDFNGSGIDSGGNKIFTVELNKGWNSRLGFSLRQDKDGNRTVVSAIYSESVAAKDGRLRVGDQLIMVNDESVEAMSTAQVIDLLRIIRGSICLRLMRKIEPAPNSIPEESPDCAGPENETQTASPNTNPATSSSPTQSSDQVDLPE